MGIWIQGTATYFYVGAPNTSCLIGNDNAYDHAWPMLEHFGYYDDANGGCHSAMQYLSCAQYGTSVWSYDTFQQIDYVRTVDHGPNLNGYGGGPALCYAHNPKLLIDLTPGAFQNGLGLPLSQGAGAVWVWQP